MKELTPFSVLVKGLLQHSEVIVNLRLYQMQRWFRHVCPQSDSVWHTILCQSIPTTDPSALPHGAPQKKRKNAKANGWTSNQKVQVQITFCHRLLMWLQTSQSPRALAGINTASLQPLIYSTEMETKWESKTFLLPCVMMMERHEEDMIFPSLWAHLAHFSLNPFLYFLLTLH